MANSKLAQNPKKSKVKSADGFTEYRATGPEQLGLFDVDALNNADDQGRDERQFLRLGAAPGQGRG